VRVERRVLRMNPERRIAVTALQNVWQVPLFMPLPEVFFIECMILIL
jgi:predicted KAP-like P-loop ATPase